MHLFSSSNLVLLSRLIVNFWNCVIDEIDNGFLEMNFYFIRSSPGVIPTIREERASVSSLSSKEDLFSATSKEDIESDAEVREINRRERQKKDSVVHQFPSKYSAAHLYLDEFYCCEK